MTVQVSDGLNTDSQALAVTVTNVNEAPTVTSAATASVPENTTAVMTVTASDPDAGTTFTYSIAGGADAAKFAINASTGALTFISAPDYEAPSDVGADNIYNVTVAASDGSLMATKAVAVTVTNVNEAPTVTSGATASVPENTTAVMAVTASDPDAGTTFTYLIAGGADAAKFAIDSATGTLTFVSAPDYENPTDVGADNVYNVTVAASDGSLTATQAVDVTVTDVNDNAPVITSNGGGASASVNVPENTTAVTTVTSTDADASSTATYSISGGADAARFAINSSTGVLSFVSAPDYEAPADVGADNVYNVTVQVSDGLNTDSQALAVAVTNVNEAPTVTSGATASVAENTTAVMTVTASDPDAGTAFTYSISGGADAAKFAINSSTGALTFISAPDYEAPTDVGADNIYNVTVAASDGSLTATKAVAVSVTNVNEAPTVTSAATASVPENTTAVMTVTASDPDAGTTFTYSIAGGADAAKFAINSSTGALTFVSAPDYETPTDAGADNVYNVTVQVSDGSLSASKAVAVTVTDVNEAPTVTSGATASVPENTTAVMTVTASDPDAGTTFTYSISGGADAAKFAINSATGALTFISAPDYEAPTDVGADNVYNVTVAASDGSLTATKAVAVSVTNVNEAPTVTSAATASVPENTTAVMTVTASDPDAGTTFTYSIAGGADAAKFSIDSATGALTFVSAPDHENPTDVGADNVYNVTVAASDSSLTATKAVAVTVTDVNDNAPVITSNGGGASASINVAENTTAVTTVTSTDADTSPTATYSISGGADAALFTINSATGALSFISAPDYEAPADAGADNVYNVTVQVSDGLNTDSQALAVTVTNVNEAPTITSAATASVPENTTAVMTVTANDPDAGTTFTYSISGGADAAKFAINSSTGALTFISAPDYEAPTDVGADNIYNVTVAASDGSLTATRAVAVTVANVNEAPSVTSGTTASVAENTTAVMTVTGTDPDAGTTLTYSIAGGADAVKFAIDSANGALSFVSAPDYETPTDAGGDNVYNVTVQVSDGILSANRAVAVTVTNVNEAPSLTNTASVSGAAGSAIGIPGMHVSDPDSATLTLSLNVSLGSLNVSAASGASVTGNGTQSITLAGTQATLNATLGTLSYQSASFAGSDTLNINVTDGVSNVSSTTALTIGAGAPVSAPTPTPTPVPDPTPAPTPTPAPQPQTPVTTAPAPAKSAPATVAPVTQAGDDQFPPPTTAHGSGTVDLISSPQLSPQVQTSSQTRSSTSAEATQPPANLLAFNLEELDLHNTSASGAVRYDWQRDARSQADGAEQEPLQIVVIPKAAQEIDGDSLLDVSPSQAGKMAATAISAGIVFWAGRSVGLLAALMASVPAWRTVDPLPILARDRRRSRRLGDELLPGVPKSPVADGNSKNANDIMPPAPSTLMVEVET